MKKIIILLVLVLTFGFIGCDNGSGGGDDDPGNTPKTVTFSLEKIGNYGIGIRITGAKWNSVVALGPQEFTGTLIIDGYDYTSSIGGQFNSNFEWIRDSDNLYVFKHLDTTKSLVGSSLSINDVNVFLSKGSAWTDGGSSMTTNYVFPDPTITF